MTATALTPTAPLVLSRAVTSRVQGPDLSAGAAGKIRGGDRLPWIELDPSSTGHADNYAPLVLLDWQVHVYGKAAQEVSNLCREKGFPLHSFAWRDDMHAAGFVRDAVYLVRPDGYVGFVDRDADAVKLEQYLSDRQLRPRS